MSVYLGEREETHDVTVTITDESGTSLFELSCQLSNENEADENVPFPASSDPERVVVTVDGTRFERDWPGFEQPRLPCDDPNRAGVENDEDGSPGIRMEADCQRVTVE